MVITKREDVTKQGFCKTLQRRSQGALPWLLMFQSARRRYKHLFRSNKRPALINHLPRIIASPWRKNLK